MTNEVIAVNGGNAPLPTVLGQGVARIPTAGKIRAGIKVLTKTAASNAKAKEIYERGVQANKSFEEIEREIAEVVPDLRNPLTPKNVPWFTVRPQDFPNPEIAREIMEAYAEDRGDGVRRLYRFPVVWPADLWQAVMPHELVAWGANERKFWSEYSPDGQVRYCKCHAPVPKDPAGKRAIRIFGGRKTTLRSENGGLCNPESCAEYQNRHCNLSGRFIFYIPGIKSIDAFELATNSFYAMNAAIQKFQAIAFMRGGRISGFLDGRRIPFYLTKRLMEVPHIDPEGRAVRVKQWIIELEAPVDVSALLRAQDDEAVIENAGRAAQVLEGPSNVYEGRNRLAEGDRAAEGDGTALDNQAEAESRSGDCAEAAVSGSGAPQSAWQRPQQPQTSQPTAEGEGPSVEDILVLAEALGIDRDRFDRYSVKKWGVGWKGNANGRKRVMRELESFTADPTALAKKVEAGLDVFA